MKLYLIQHGLALAKEKYPGVAFFQKQMIK
jgi:hypothetical protein